MIIRTFIVLIFSGALLATLSTCASFDRIAVTKFEPIRTEEGAQVFKFTAFADAVYPLMSKEAEKTRIGWLETWLIDNGYNPKKYDVISRVPVLRNKGLLGDAYDIYYEIRAFK